MTAAEHDLPAGQFNIRALIREVSASADDLNTSKIAAEVDRRIAPEGRDEALRQALPYVVRACLQNARNRTAIRPESGASDENVRLLNRPPRSWKVAGLRAHGEYWRKALAERYATEGANEGKRLADLTRDDLLYNIRIREDAARRSAAKALQLRGLLDLVTRYDVAHVGDLPESVLAQTLVSVA